MRSKNGNDDLNLAKIERLSVFDQVYGTLRTSLMAGQFAPGQKLTSRGVAEAMAVSDMPVRAALNRLVAEEGLEQRANGTIWVPTVSRARFREVMSLRALLERRATEYATPHFDRRGVDGLRKLSVALDESVRAQDIGRYLDTNQKLKFAIYARCDAPMLLSFIETVWLQAGPYLRQLSQGLSGIQRINFHDQAIAAIAAGDANEAGLAIERDILAGMDDILANADFPETGSQPEDAR